jgi:multidrug efflux pump subunit AcrA (membrane-fusion protein)
MASRLSQRFIIITVIIIFSCSSHLEHGAPFGVSVITHILRHTVGVLWTSDQSVAETSTYTGQLNV